MYRKYTWPNVENNLLNWLNSVTMSVFTIRIYLYIRIITARCPVSRVL